MKKSVCIRSRIKFIWIFTFPFKQVYFIYKLIWNIAVQDNRVTRVYISIQQTKETRMNSAT